MARTELNVLFKKMQRDDKKDVLKFEYKNKDEDEKIKLPQAIYSLVGEMVNIEVEGCNGPVTAELKNANADSKKIVLDLALRGDSANKAVDIFLKAGTDVKIYIEPSQSSLEDFNEDQEDPHEGIEYDVDLAGGVEVKNEEAAEPKEEVSFDGDDLD